MKAILNIWEENNDIRIYRSHTVINKTVKPARSALKVTEEQRYDGIFIETLTYSERNVAKV